MNRTAAIARIHRGLGFRAGLTTSIIDALQEAQRELEKGKTLPKFLLQQDQTLSLTANVNYVALPSGFLRESDDNRPHYTPTGEDTPFYLERKDYQIATLTFAGDDNAGPQVYALRKSTLVVFPTPDIAYTLTWDYYKAGTLLTTDIENEWLASEPDWLIGEAGYRIAKDVRDNTAMQIFDDMRKTARASWLAEEIADEESAGPFYMGENL